LHLKFDITFVKNGDTRQIWLDGMKVLEQDRPEVLPTDFTLLSIGSFRQGNFSFQGKLDDFAIFDGALTADQIGRLAAGESALTVAMPEPSLTGNFNLSNAVENADLTLLLNNWGATVPPTPAGWLGTPLTTPAVDNDELTALLNNWGATIGAGSASAAVVPEPATLVLMILAAVGCCGFVKRGSGALRSD
jgi:Concanavalin A-like lectin/glucanases superfamily